MRPFTWRDGERTIRFGRGVIAEAAELLGERYELLTTERAAGDQPEIVGRAATVHHVPDGRVDEIAAELLRSVDGDRLVALGGGRVIDTAKAIAAARGGDATVSAIPTTLSSAEMTVVHRHAVGVPPETPRVRPALVLNDPALCASQPEDQLAASTLNALAHAAEGPVTPLANPVSTLAAREAARLLVDAWSGPEPDRDALALGSLLAGYSIDSAMYGLHHVLSQTLVRFTPAGHGLANAIMLPHTLHALAQRFPEQHAKLAAAVGGDPSEVAAAITRRTGATRLRELGVTEDMLDECAAAASERAELHLTPPPAGLDELRGLYAAAF